MKKQMLLTAGILALATLAGCSKNEDITKERLVRKDIYSVNEFGGLNHLDERVELLFKANSEVPYISLADCAKNLSELRQSGVKGSVTYNEAEGKFTNNESVSVSFDANKQTITFSDFDAFNNYSGAKGETLALANTKSKIKIKSSNYTPGQAFTVDLGKYSQIDIYKKDGKSYIPLSIFNDLFLSPTGLVNIVYNFENVFVLPYSTNLFETDEEGKRKLTEVGEKFYATGKKSTVSQEYAEFYYQNILLNFDYLYGLKDVKYNNDFDAWLTTKGYKADMLSGDVHKMDNAFVYALSDLVDGHTSVTTTSTYYNFGEDNIDRSKVNSDLQKWLNGSSALEEQRGLDIGYKEFTEGEFADQGVAYLTFNEFTILSDEAVKPGTDGKYSKFDQDTNSNTLMAAAYKAITTGANKDNIKTVVIDLATNGGGAADSMIFMLGNLVGDFTAYAQNPATGAKTEIKYTVDINLDGKFDDNDKPLISLGKKIVFLDSKYSFSCANSMPIYAKEANANVMTMGQKTGGGTCAVRISFTALGSAYQSSSLTKLSKKQDDKLVDLEDGIAADMAVEENQLIKREEVAKKLLAH